MKQFVWVALGGLFVALSMLAASHKNKTIIGRIETACLPEWGLGIEAKIDTGSYRSSLHVSRLELLEGKPKRVRFDTSDRHGTIHTLEAQVVKQTRVKSSSGHVEKRPLVQTRLGIGGQEFDAFVSLTDRSNMRFPMLIGRRFLKGRFLIDPAKTYTTEPPTCSKNREE